MQSIYRYADLLQEIFAFFFEFFCRRKSGLNFAALLSLNPWCSIYYEYSSTLRPVLLPQAQRERPRDNALDRAKYVALARDLPRPSPVPPKGNRTIAKSRR
jgi:hypothetical protein